MRNRHGGVVSNAAAVLRRRRGVGVWGYADMGRGRGFLKCITPSRYPGAAG